MTHWKKQNSRKGCSKGFSLVELLVAVAIVALLSAIAYPSFMQSVRKSKRTDAQTALTRTTNNLERFFSANRTYTLDESELGLLMDDGDAFSDERNYVITVTAGASGIGSSYVVTATAVAGTSQASDTGCTALTVDSQGRRTPDPAGSKCW